MKIASRNSSMTVPTISLLPLLFMLDKTPNFVMKHHLIIIAIWFVSFVIVSCQDYPSPLDNSSPKEAPIQTQSIITLPNNETLISVVSATNNEAFPANHALESTASRAEAINAPCPDIRSFAPLCNAQHQSLSQIKEDPAPEVLFAVESKNIGKHYLISDEKHPDLFKSSIENKGGTYMGVGFEQGYLYIGWQRPSLAFLIDYDPWIILNHRILIEIMKQCPNAECLFDHFNQINLIDEFMHIQTTTVSTLTSKSSKHRILRLRHVVSIALAKLHKSELPNMMNNPDIYNNIRTLALAGRLQIVQANLLASQGIQSIANTLNALGATLDTLYLSNAEQYWNYSNQFKSNMLSLPFAEDAIIMRTRATYPHNGDYRYSIQNASIFKSWMSSHKTKSVKQMTKHVKRRDLAQFFLIVDDLPPAAP